MEIFLLIVGLVMILAGANFLTDGSVALAKRLRMPEFLIGLTIVAVGTSTPELVVSVLAAIGKNGSMAIGNIVGSNIFNVFFILGVCALVKPLPLTAGNIRRDIPFGVIVSVLLLIMAFDATLHLGAENRLGRMDGIVMLLCYVGLMTYTIRDTRRQSTPRSEVITEGKHMKIWLMTILILGGLAGLVWGGNIFLENAVALARKFHVSESTIAITLVAGGTSLPELGASLVSLLKGRSELALGNVIGSNIANILLILGISSTIHPLTLGGITMVDMLMVLLSAVLLFVAAFTFKRRALDRWEGGIFVAIYIAYIWYLVK